MRLADQWRMEAGSLTLRPASVTRVLTALAVLLVVLSVGIQLVKYMTGNDQISLPILNLNSEHNVPTLFSVILLLLASLLLAIIAALEKTRPKSSALQWSVLSIGFVLMAIDEFVSIHEKLIEPMRGWLGGQDLGIFYFAWVIPAIALVAVLGVYFLPFLFRLPARTRFGFVLAAAMYLGGAIGVELIEGKIKEAQGNSPIFNLLVTLEEGLEMAGMIVFIHVLLSYLGEHHGELRFNIVKGDSSPT